jgi:hypothetical protein
VIRGAVCALLLTGCAGWQGLQFEPSEKNPTNFCAIFCPGSGFISPIQLICRADKRQMADIRVTGRRTERNVDGTVKSDVWITKEGDYPVNRVARMSCSSFIRAAVASRATEERGKHPGEPEPWELPWRSP